MPLSRSTTRLIALFLDECLPPVLRDSRAVMWLPFRLLFGKRAAMVLDFKDDVTRMSDGKIGDVYRSMEGLAIERETDLSPAALRAVLDAAIGDTVLEVGCGRGHLSAQLAERRKVTACDVFVPRWTRASVPSVSFLEAALPALPFASGSFDTVVSTHTLEHVRDIRAALCELRRVAAKRLVIVLPRQREYRYTFDLHLHFFPYAHSVAALMGADSATCLLAGGDWVYVEDLSSGAARGVNADRGA
jgi:ubiquinone/menaquinone biosynthesis C-methylase UbiE